MAEGEEIARVFHTLTQELSNVSSALTTQGIAANIPKFDGNPKFFREWVKSIDKYAVLLNAPNEKKHLMAFQSATGAVSGFIERYMNANPHNTWEQLKRQLTARFSDVTDPQFALSLLRKLKQKQGENIQVFAERILSLAEEAFLGQAGDMVEQQLIETFVDGISNDQLKLKILRDRPNTLQGAISIATNEQNLRARVALSHPVRNEQPMEVDHSRNRRFFRPHQNNRQINAVKCWKCGQEGHILRDCRSEQTHRQNRPSVGHGRGWSRSSKQPGVQGN